jgi:hypothetical protein
LPAAEEKLIHALYFLSALALLLITGLSFVAQAKAKPLYNSYKAISATDLSNH